MGFSPFISIYVLSPGSFSSDRRIRVPSAVATAPKRPVESTVQAIGIASLERAKLGAGLEENHEPRMIYDISNNNRIEAMDYHWAPSNYSLVISVDNHQL